MFPLRKGISAKGKRIDIEGVEVFPGYLIIIPIETIIKLPRMSFPRKRESIFSKAL
jgi:hypothetical protein